MAPAMAESTAQTPLLSFSGKEEPTTQIVMESNTRSKNNIATPSNSEQELQFYDRTIILSVSREVAFGYLILLTGGAADYELPMPEEASSSIKQQSQNDTKPSGKPLAPTLDEESASLAYAAIVDGNVLHACFGLKTSANGRASTNTIPAKQSSSVFCCFPKSPATLDALQVVLPHLTMNKLRMQKLIEMLREVRDLHFDALDTDSVSKGDPAKVPLYLQVIQSYIHCFAAIVRYHDKKKHLKIDSKDKKGNGIISCCSRVFSRLLSKKKNNPQLEQLQKKTIQDIECGFLGMRETIGVSLEKMASETAFTGISLGE